MRYRLIRLSFFVLSVGILLALPSTTTVRAQVIRVMTFNILQGGGDASNVGFDDAAFGGSRMDEIARAILEPQAELVGIQENCRGDALLNELRKQSGDDRWSRFGSIYSVYPLEGIKEYDGAFTPCAATIKIGARRICVLNTHWSPSPYGPDLIQEAIRTGAVDDTDEFRASILERSRKPEGLRGYNHTRGFIEGRDPQEAMIVLGDFNEPSHLDWTGRYSKEGADRWSRNPTDQPLRMLMRWQGSQMMEELKFVDSYREVHRDEVQKPGNTWTPEYPDGTVGRRPFGDQIHDRIDRIYFRGPFQVSDASVFGEDSAFSDKVFSGTWPSDHRAVVCVVELEEAPSR
jgi:hypothetical protein